MDALKQTLDNLRTKLLEDEVIREMFEQNFPDLDYNDTVTITIVELYEFAVSQEMSPQDLSIQGIKLFFGNVLSQTEEDDGQTIEEHLGSEEDEGYGKA